LLVAMAACSTRGWRDPCRLVRGLGAERVLANRGRGAGIRFVVPIIFGATLLGLWEMAVRLYEISPIILPAPSAIGPPCENTRPTSGPISSRRS
jgi:hypothetical protein